MKRITRLMFLCVFLWTGLGAAPAAGLASQTPAPDPLAPETARIYLPLIRSTTPGFTVAGQVTDENGNPLSGVRVSDGAGGEAVTTSNGSYSLTLDKNTVETSFAPLLGVTGFAPASMDVNVKSNISSLDFTGMSGCAELIGNGGFEDGSFWELNGAQYDTSIVNTGAHSLRLGPGVDDGNPSGSLSALTPAFTIPSTAKDPLLRLWLFTRSVTPLSPAPSVAAPSDNFFGPDTDLNDLQSVKVLDANGSPLETLWEGQGQNNQEWGLVQYNLYKYTGLTIRIGLFVTNDGLNSKTSLYADDVSLGTCPTIFAPDLDNNGISAVEMPSACANRIINPGFETNGGWGIPYTAYPAQYITYPAFAGNRSMQTGILNDYHNRYSYSDVWQTVYIPSNATSAKLRLVNLLYSDDPTAAPEDQAEGADLAQSDPHFAAGAVWGEAPLAYDAMYVLILNPSDGTIMQTLRSWSARNVNWTARDWDLTAYRGMNIRIQFGTYNDGWGGVTSMLVDDLTVDVCTLVEPPPPSATCPAGQSQRLANTGFEQAGAWYLPVTAYSARYTNQKSYTGARSMLTGILNPWHNRYSYSDFAQYTVIPYASYASLNFYAYFKSNDVGYDRQYLLVLNNWGYWIDTLMWKSSRNTSGWVKVPIDMTYKPYNGWPIRLQFGTYNNGYGGVTSMYVDDVTLCTVP